MGKIFKASVLWLFVLSVVQLTSSQGLDTTIIDSFQVKTDIRFRFATTQMVSVVRNVADQAQEIGFDVTLPKEAFIVNFTMAIEGKEYVGEVKKKNAAKQQYKTAISKGQSAGHIKEAARHSNVFKVSVNVANGSAVTFTLTYQEMLRRKHGHYENEIHVNLDRPVDDFSIEIFIQENRDITYVRTPALRKGVLLKDEVEAENDLAVINQPTPKTAHITYAPTLTEQGKGVSARFAVQYDVNHSQKGEVLVVDGYFIHFFAPNAPALPKDIFFVLDVSGSMSGNKIKQLKESMVTILKDLKPEDRFNILIFSDVVTKWKKTLEGANTDVVQEAVNFVNRMQASGGTDINNALLTALKELKGREETNRVGMIFFLTDGQPSSGETNTNSITANVKRANTDSVAIYGLAFGTGADFNFIKAMSVQNSGFARKIYEASDSALQVASLYDEISAVAMKNVKIKYMSGVSNTTDTEFPVVFNGSEIAIGGRLNLDQKEFRAEIEGTQKSGDLDLVLDIPDLSEVTVHTDDSLNKFFTMPRDFAGIVEKMWAFLTIKQLLKEKERVMNNKEQTQKLDKKILHMSLKYKFVTPLTSMVVTKPGNDNKNKKIESGLQDSDERHPFSHNRLLAYHTGGSGGWNAFGRTGSFLQSSIHKSYNLGNSFGSLQNFQGHIAGFNKNLAPISRPKTVLSTVAAPVPTIVKPTGNQVQLVNILSSLLIRSPKTSVCVAPNHLLKGNNILLEGLNGQLKIELSTDCSTSCSTVLPQTFVVTDNGKATTVKLNSLKFWQGRNKMKITTPAVESIITRTVSNSQVLYDIEVVLKTQDAFSGMLGNFLNKSTTVKQNTNVSTACKNKQVDVSM